MSIKFREQSWPELKKSIEADTLIVLPVGQIEQHGTHLPVETDCKISEEICQRAAEKANQHVPVLVMPCIWSGYSNKEVANWPGTFCIKAETVIALVFDICGSLIEMGFKKIVIVNSHGQHKGILEIATRKIGDAYNIHMAVLNTLSTRAITTFPSRGSALTIAPLSPISTT